MALDNFNASHDNISSGEKDKAVMLAAVASFIHHIYQQAFCFCNYLGPADYVAQKQAQEVQRPRQAY
jgi:hypothetical protein